MINFSVVRIHLFHFSVQVTTWCWSESSCGLIGTEGICIGFIDIVALVGRWKFIHLLFRHPLSEHPIVLSNLSVKLSFGGVSALGIINYWHYHQLFLQWRLKILIWLQSPVYLCVIAKVSRGRIKKTISTGRDIATLSKGGISKIISTGKNIATLSRGVIFKTSIQAEILKKSQDVEIIKPSIQAEILKKYQEVGFIKHQYRQKNCNIPKRWNF